MSKVIFSISYSVYPDKIDKYLKKISYLKDLLSEENYQYSVYRDKKNPYEFEEIYVFDSEEDFEEFDDSANEEASAIIFEIANNYVVDKKQNYKTLIEVED
jgi:hypothetical protein